MEADFPSTTKVEEYRGRAIQYYRNSEEAVAREEYEKVGELLWGAVANYIHALNELKGKKVIRSHGGVLSQGREIAKETGDKRLLNAIEEADEMHEQFYGGAKRLSSFPERYAEVVYAITVLDGLLKKTLSPDG